MLQCRFLFDFAYKICYNNAVGMIRAFFTKGARAMSAVSFTGHRQISFGAVRPALRRTLQDLIENGADTFYAGGAWGFDTLAAQTVLSLRLTYPHIKLGLVLPCPPDEHSSTFTPRQRKLYYDILRAADSVECVSESYTKDCMRLRNARLTELADICVCCYDERRSATGTGQTVRMAEKKGIEIINIFNKEQTAM